MSEKSGFFNAELSQDGVTYDRVYLAESFASYFARFIGNGIFVNPATQLQVIQNTIPDMTVKVRAGAGFINGYWYENDGELSLSVPLAGGTTNRIDTIVMRWDATSRAISVTVKKGDDYGDIAFPKALTRDGNTYELALAYVDVPKGTTSIVDAKITDKRSDSAVCGYVTGVVSQIDATNLFTQFESRFDEWFDTIKGQLAGDPAGQLNDAINNHKQDYMLQVPYAGITSGTSSAYTIATPTISSLVEGMAVAIKAHIASGASCTLDWDGKGAKSIKKPNGANATLKLNGIYTLRYDGTNFILQGEGASGNATASNLLSGKTATTDAGDIVGTMPDKSGANTAALASYGYSGGLQLRPPAGYYDGVSGTTVYSEDPDFIASNFLANKNVFGLQGAIPLMSGANQQAVQSTYANGLVYLRPPAGYYNGADYWVYLADPDFLPGNFVASKNIFGMQGSIPVIGVDTAAINTVAQNGRVYLRPPVDTYWNSSGYYVYTDDPDFIPSNILNTANIFGMGGTAIAGKRYASGGLTPSVSGTIHSLVYYYGGTQSSQNFYCITISGLTFAPKIVRVYMNANTGIRTVAEQGGVWAGSQTGDPYRIPWSGNASIYIMSGGFRVPLMAGADPAQPVTWEAWE
jgi:hypothetical protein